jgi:citrate/tricarballylate utilization protein
VQPPEGLSREAAELARGDARVIPIATPAQTEDETEAARVLQICNACRYCEGFCAVFPAMTRRLSFAKNDVNFLANLCHNCGACLHACQYAPPHAFAVNVPRTMARVRLGTYAEYARPSALGALYRKNGLTAAIALSASLGVFLALAAAMQGSLWRAVGDGNFYAVFPHNLMVAMFGPIFLYAALTLALGVRGFWRQEEPGPPSPPAVREAVADALTLKYLDGGHRDGCNDEDDRFTLRRRRFHHFAFYGFLLCFAATCVATLYHYAFGWPAPYGYASLPKILGISGGVALVVGTVGLFRLNLRRHPLQQDTAQQPMDRAFIALLFLTALSGLALMLLKHTPALALSLSVHLGAVMALFLTLPYGKFAHAVYRVAALLKWSIERRQPSRLQLGDE